MTHDVDITCDYAYYETFSNCCIRLGPVPSLYKGGDDNRQAYLLKHSIADQ